VCSQEGDGEGEFTLVQKLQDAEAATPTDQSKSFADAVSSNRNNAVQNQSNPAPGVATLLRWGGLRASVTVTAMLAGA